MSNKIFKDIKLLRHTTTPDLSSDVALLVCCVFDVFFQFQRLLSLTEIDERVCGGMGNFGISYEQFGRGRRGLLYLVFIIFTFFIG